MLRFYIRANNNDYNRSWRMSVADSPLHVTGTPNPDCKGDYFYDPNPAPAGFTRGFWRVDNAYCIFGRPYAGGNYWFITAAARAYTAVTKYAWQNYPDAGYVGTYSGMVPYTGTPVVA